MRRSVVLLVRFTVEGRVPLADVSVAGSFASVMVGEISYRVVDVPS